MWLNMGSGAAAEMAALCAFDWVLIDREHGAGGYQNLAEQLWALQAGPTTPIVRVSHLSASEMKRCLDAGCGGIMVPNVNSAAEAARAAEAFRLAPVGLRGAATSTRSSLYGYGYEDYVTNANDALTLVVQIESCEAVAEVDQIAATPGVDVLFVGPTDLGTSLRSQSSITFDSALRDVLAAASAHGKAAGILARTPQDARAYIERGFNFISCGSDRGVLAGGIRANAAALGLLESRS
jgi:2-keto-3-deoxy-L-rhamnonate aldolase RhmA